MACASSNQSSCHLSPTVFRFPRIPACLFLPKSITSFTTPETSSSFTSHDRPPPASFTPLLYVFPDRSSLNPFLLNLWQILSTFPIYILASPFTSHLRPLYIHTSSISYLSIHTCLYIHAYYTSHPIPLFTYILNY